MKTVTPNIIGNEEDNPASQYASGQQYPSLNKQNNEGSMSLEGDTSNYKDITPSLIRGRRTKSKTRP